MSRGQSMTKDIFIWRSVAIHGLTYDYSLVNYQNCDTPVDIICPIHGLFKQRPFIHYRGGRCKQCADSLRGKIFTKDSFIQNAIKMHGDKYDYSRSIYTGARNKLIITCHIHGDFTTSATNHLRGRGCKECHIDKLKVIYNLTTEQFVERANLVHEYYYDYSQVVYRKCSEKVTILCPIHREFTQTPSNHYTGKGCPKCSSSTGEGRVRKVLQELSIDFNEQQVFHNCKSLRCLPFDFYIPSINTCIEYDGIQHYKPVEFFGGQERFEERQKVDNIKSKYCKDNDINLVRISYKEKITKELILLRLQNVTNTYL